jgi:beta-glucosidase
MRALVLAALLATVSTVAPAQDVQKGVVHPEVWPTAKSPLPPDPAIEARIDALLAKMTIEEKVGQTLQPEFKSITPDDVRRYHIGSIENGGGSTPGGAKHASVQDWLKLIEGYYDASVDPSNTGVRIPLMWASDAVHGHNNVFGATLFPHNIGLGAMRDPQLMRKIGAATAEEVRATGIDWSFAPTLAVVRDDRWGRTYESYSEDPKLVAEYAREMVLGLQGEGKTFLDQDHVISTAKHFLGDGGTDGGRDQGDNLSSEADLARIHAVGYPAAIDAGVQAVMASFSSWQGVKMHANKGLLTDVLKDRMGFDGLVIGDWNAHGQVPGCTTSDCPAAFNAGVDVYNVPQDFKALYANMVAEVKSGAIPMARLNDAVRRVLRVKLRAHVFDEPRPMDRPHAGDVSLMGSQAHRDVARQAVAESLVLLKNDRQILPIRPGKRVLIVGDAANSIARQTGGWTLSWQGADNTNADFPGATSIEEGLSRAIVRAGGHIDYCPNRSDPFCRSKLKPDVAVVVFGETPYAEFQGDQADVALHAGADESLELIRKLKAAHVPVVAVLLSGRPLYMNPWINSSDAFVAGWLPGSEGEGVADVLVSRRDGKPNKDFRGKLSFSWPKRPDQTPLKVGDVGYDPQFAYGYGLSYASPKRVGRLPEVADASAAGPRGVFLADGRGVNGFSLSIGDAQAPKIAAVGARTATYGSEALTLVDVDHHRQEDARRARWTGAEPAWLELSTAKPVDLSREANGAMSLQIEVRVDQPPRGEVELYVAGDGTKGALRIGRALAELDSARWTTLRIPLSCFATAGADLTKVQTLGLKTGTALTLSLGEARLAEHAAGDRCPSELPSPARSAGP